MDYINMIMNNNYSTTGASENYDFHIEYTQGADDTLENFIDELSDQLSGTKTKHVDKHIKTKLKLPKNEKRSAKSTSHEPNPHTVEDNSSFDESSADGNIEHNSSFDESESTGDTEFDPNEFSKFTVETNSREISDEYSLSEDESAQSVSLDEPTRGALEIESLINDFESREF